MIQIARKLFNFDRIRHEYMESLLFLRYFLGQRVGLERRNLDQATQFHGPSRV